MKNKIIFSLFGLIAGGILGASAMSIVQQAKSPAAPSGSSSVTIEGVIACLPHKNTDGIQTLVCVIGLHATDNKMYGLSFSGDPSALGSAAGNNKKYRVSGTLSPAKDTEIYKTDGTIAVQSYEVLP